MPVRHAIILLSGGLDSATALAVAARDGFIAHTLAFDYGQRHRHELAAAARVSAALGAASHRIIQLDLRAFGGSALTADIDVPKDRSAAEMAAGGGGGQGQGGAASGGVPITYVPARNLIFLSVATALAETLSAHDIFIGVNAIDYSGYPDCRPEFIEAFQNAANLGTAMGTPTLRGGASNPPNHGGIHIHAPLIHLSKAEIIRLGTSLGVDFGLTHSCYDPIVRGDGVLACGRCDSCQLRREGFLAAGVPDPTCYV